MSNIFAYIAYAMAWIAVSIAVSIGIYMTGSLISLWAFAFPAAISLTSSEKGDGRK